MAVILWQRGSSSWSCDNLKITKLLPSLRHTKKNKHHIWLIFLKCNIYSFKAHANRVHMPSLRIQKSLYKHIYHSNDDCFILATMLERANACISVGVLTHEQLNNIVETPILNGDDEERLNILCDLILTTYEDVFIYECKY